MKKTLFLLFSIFYCSNSFSSPTFRNLDDIISPTPKVLMNRGHNRAEELLGYSDVNNYPSTEISRVYEGFKEPLKNQFFIDKLNDLYAKVQEKVFLETDEFFHFCYQCCVVSSLDQLNEQDQESLDWDELFEIRGAYRHDVKIGGHIVIASSAGYFGLQTWLNAYLFNDTTLIGIPFRGMRAHGGFYDPRAAFSHDISHSYETRFIEGIDFYRKLHTNALTELNDDDYIKHCTLLFLLIHENSFGIDPVGENKLDYLDKEIESTISQIFYPDGFESFCNQEVNNLMTKSKEIDKNIGFTIRIDDHGKITEESIIINRDFDEVTEKFFEKIEKTNEGIKVTFKDNVITNEKREFTTMKNPFLGYASHKANYADIAYLLKYAGYPLKLEKNDDQTVKYSQKQAFASYMLLKDEVMALWRCLACFKIYFL